MYKILEDYLIKNSTIETIGEFAILWAMIEEKYFDKCCTNKKLDKVTIVNNNVDLDNCVDRMKKSLMLYYSSSDEVINRLCLRKGDRYFLSHIKDLLEKDDCEMRDKFFGALCICFRIRNNLLHGEKVFWLLNQQRDLLDSCCAFLNELLSEDHSIRIVEE